MVTSQARVVVVGGSLSGLRVTENLRLQGFDGEITVLSGEPHPPYTRPPLSKQLLTRTPTLAEVEFRRRPEADLADWRLSTEAVSSDLAAQTVTLSDGEVLPYDGLVVATGVRSRRLPASLCPGAHYIRTLEDARALQEQLHDGARVAVVGAGFIGCEVAATAIGLGCEVDVVAADPTPLYVPLGEVVGTVVRRRHEAAGVRFHLGRTVGLVTETDDGRVLELDDGTRIDCDVIVVAIGSIPNTEWLEGNGLDLSNGVLCDDRLRAGGLRGVVAVGDIARFPHRWFDSTPRRIEHWQMPTDTAKRAAATLLADLSGHAVDQEHFTPVPWFWSDQYDSKLQSFGLPGLGSAAEVLDGDLAAGEAVVAYRRDDGKLVGVVLLGLPKAAPGARRRLIQDLAS